EVFVFARYGQSHFLYHLAEGRGAWAGKLKLFWPLFGLLGGLAAPVGLLALVAWRVPMRMVVACAGLVAVGFLVVGVLPAGPPGSLRTDNIVFGTAGLVTAGVLAATVVRALARRGDTPGQRTDRFLAWWLL